MLLQTLSVDQFQYAPKAKLLIQITATPALPLNAEEACGYHTTFPTMAIGVTGKSN
jgi:hypothetical protein